MRNHKIQQIFRKTTPALSSAGKRSLAILSIAVLLQSILLLRVVLQIREIYSILLLLTERLNLLS